MSQSKAPQASDPGAAEIAEAVNARSKSIQAEWTRQVNLVRKQEFAYLRSVIKRDGGDASQLALAGTPVRALKTEKVRGETLKKIDEIEAQLELLWQASRGKRSNAEFASASDLAQAFLLSDPPGETTDSLLTALTATTGVLTQTLHHAEMPNSVLLAPTMESPSATSVEPRPSWDRTPVPKEPIFNDAALSAAATLFARADYALATQLLQRSTLHGMGGRAAQLQRLLALLEIYRATGQQSAFDSLVLEHFDYWGGCTPQWSATPRVRGGTGQTHQPPADPDGSRFYASSGDDAQLWRCPAVLNTAAVRTLRAHWQAHGHCGVDWSALNTLDAAASAELIACFTQAQGAPKQLIFVDTSNLLQVLAQATPQGQPQVARSLWDLRFCLLTLMQMHTAFDAAATDFCLTYIEPAPVWKASEIQFIGDAPRPAPQTANTATTSKSKPWSLQGHVLGASGLGLPELPAQPAPQRITVACAALVRMDADAIAQLLQWLRRAKAQKADVHLQDVGVLVGAAWAAAGVDALAQVHLRDLG